VNKIHLLRAALSSADFMQVLREEAENRDVEFVWDKTKDYAAAAQYPYDSADAGQLKYFLNFVLPPPLRDVLASVAFERVFGRREREISNSLYMTTDQIKELGRLRFVGTHGHEHVPLGLLPMVMVKHLVVESMNYLEHWTGYRPYAISYPYGSYEACPREVGEVASSQGIDFGFTVEKAANAPNNFEDPMFLARFDCNDVPGGKDPLLNAENLFQGAGIRPRLQSPDLLDKPFYNDCFLVFVRSSSTTLRLVAWVSLSSTVRPIICTWFSSSFTLSIGLTIRSATMNSSNGNSVIDRTRIVAAIHSDWDSLISGSLPAWVTFPLK
jgi:peptidoglycan/xylan/chitin deacetylase (PgdA/CDA1 family)